MDERIEAALALWDQAPHMTYAECLEFVWAVES